MLLFFESGLAISDVHASDHGIRCCASHTCSDRVKIQGECDTTPTQPASLQAAPGSAKKLLPGEPEFDSSPARPQQRSPLPEKAAKKSIALDFLAGTSLMVNNLLRNWTKHPGGLDFSAAIAVATY